MPQDIGIKRQKNLLELIENKHVHSCQVAKKQTIAASHKLMRQ